MTYRASLAGTQVEVSVEPDVLRIGDLDVPYHEMDDVVLDGWTLTMRGPSREVTISQLGAARDTFMRDFRKARLHARRAAMLQSGAADPIDVYEAFRGDQPVTVGLHSDGLTVEADAGAPDYVPLSCIRSVERNGYQFTLQVRGLDPVTFGRLGARTDEFVQDLDAARRDLRARTRDAYAELDPALADLSAPDGWAVTRSEAGVSWPSLRAAFAAQNRADEIDALEKIAGDGVRLGLKAAFNGRTMPFALAPSAGRVAVESADEEARATFVFTTGDVDRLNAVLLLTSFRREALFFPEDQLARWAVAVRMLPVVRWAREALAARIVHDASWQRNVEAALAGETSAASG